VLLDPISFELPDWQEPLSVGHAKRWEWFDRLSGSNGDGHFLASPIRIWQRPVQLFGDN
jgi:hypothetical protein